MIQLPALSFPPASAVRPSQPGQLLGLGRRRGAASQEGPRLPELGPAEQRVKNRRGVSPQAMGRAEKTETSLKLN